MDSHRTRPHVMCAAGGEALLRVAGWDFSDRPLLCY